MKKFDICLMNPPFGDTLNGVFLDQRFLEKTLTFSNNVVAVMPNRINSKTTIANALMQNKRLYNIELLNGNDIFNISTIWKYVCIYTYFEHPEFDMITHINKDGSETQISRDFESREQFIKSFIFGDDIIDLILRLKPLYEDLHQKYKTMVNDTNDFIYEENRLSFGKRKAGIHKEDNIKLNRVKKYLKDNIFKYCLYKGSFNHDYDAVQEWHHEDPDKLFNGQICWLTNKEDVKNNIKYWLEHPLADFWRKFYMYKDPAAGCCYCAIPAVKFDMSENDFKKYINNLYHFSDEDIQILKNFNVHNIDLIK